jgi:hypothetical protein
MRNYLHRKALARFAVGVSVGAVVPISVVAVAGLSAAPFALAAGGVAALLGVSALRGPRRRATRHAH